MLLLPMASSELGRDQANWLTVAMALEHGSVMYRDVAVVNTPGLGFIFAVVNMMTGAPELTPWIVHSLTVLVTILAGYGLVSATSGPAAARGAALLAAILWPQTMGWWELAQKDGVAFMFALSAMAVFAQNPNRIGLNLLAGALFGAAVFTKTSAAIYALPGAVLLITESKSIGALLRRAVWISIGVIVFLLLPAIYLTLNDAWASAKASLIDRALAYGGFQRLSPLEILRKLWSQITSYFWFALLLPAVLVGLPLGRKKIPVALIAMLLTTVFAVVIQGRGWVYHSVPVAASTALILGTCIGLILENGGRLQRGLSILLVTAAALISLDANRQRLSEYGKALIQEAPTDWYDKTFNVRGKAGPSESRKVAKWIKTVTNLDERIFVWGMESQIYILSDRMFIGPSFADAPIWHPQLAKDKPAYFEKKSLSFLSEINATPPKVFIIARNDANPVEPMDSDDALQTLPSLAAFIEQNYTLQFSTTNLLAYQLN